MCEECKKQIAALIAENEALKGPHDWLAEDLIKELVDNAQAIQENADDGEDDPFVIVLLASASRIRRQEAKIDQLKADNERLRADYAGLARFNPEWDRVAAAQDSVREHMAMVVQLKAEVAGLRTGYEAYERVNAELKAEVEALREEVALGDKIIADRDRLLNMFDCPAHGQCIPYAMEQIEALRKDAEQWRALVGRAKSPVIGYTGCVICGAYTDHGGLPCPKTRAAANALAMENQRITPVEPLRVPHPLDAAMGKGEKS